jgi:hypothetical protein
VEALGGFLRAFALVQAHGPDGALGLMDAREEGWSAVFADAMLVFSGELERLRAKRRAREAERMRTRAAADRVRRG